MSVKFGLHYSKNILEFLFVIYNLELLKTTIKKLLKHDLLNETFKFIYCMMATSLLMVISS